MRIFIGYDEREARAYKACVKSIHTNCTGFFRMANPIKFDDMQRLGFNRQAGPNEKPSTEFAFTRFLVPWLCKYQGWAMFVDCDFIFTRDLRHLFAHRDPNCAVMCVQHPEYAPAQQIKMDGCEQTTFPRKNWSSLMLFNCSHPLTQKLTLEAVNTESAGWLHQMEWAEDKVGSLPRDWNHLVGEKAYPKLGYGILPSAIHYTNGCPFMEGYEKCDYASEYWKYDKQHEDSTV